MPALDRKAAAKLISSRHKLYAKNRRRWDQLLDSLEGGETYRNATYGNDRFGVPIYNLVRHKREFPLPSDRNQLGALSYPSVGPGQDPTVLSGESDFELRRARTVVPTIFGHAIHLHLARIFCKEVTRAVEQPVSTDPEDRSEAWLPLADAERIKEWWEDVDGSGRLGIDKWIRTEFGPIFFALGQLDVLFDRPKAPPGVEIRTQADVEALDLDEVYAAIVLPSRVLNWKCDDYGQYEWVLIEEVHEEDDGTETTYYRHWTEVDSTLYTEDGTAVDGSTIPHPYGRPPIVRVIDRKDRREKNIGRSAYEPIADLMRSIYNRESELVLSDTQQAFPILQAPEELLNAETGIAIGPNYVLAMKRLPDGSYQGYECIDFPKGSVDSLRTNIQNERDRADREAGLVKPAGAESAKTTAQSGISKWFDYREGSELLRSRAEALADAERELIRLALTVLLGRPLDRRLNLPIQVTYPTDFDLLDPTELVAMLDDLAKIIPSLGQIPTLEASMLKQFAREAVRGRSDEFYAEIDKEIEALIAAKVNQNQAMQEAVGSGNVRLFGDNLADDAEFEVGGETESDGNEDDDETDPRQAKPDIDPPFPTINV